MEKVTLFWQGAHLTFIFASVVWLNRSAIQKWILGLLLSSVSFSETLMGKHLSWDTRKKVGGNKSTTKQKKTSGAPNGRQSNRTPYILAKMYRGYNHQPDSRHHGNWGRQVLENPQSLLRFWFDRARCNFCFAREWTWYCCFDRERT